MVGYAKSLGMAKTAAETTGEKIDPNQELIALGMSNAGSGFSSGYVVVGSLGKKSKNTLEGSLSQGQASTAGE